MEKKEIGNTGVKLSRVGFGAASMGNLFEVISETEARDVLSQAWNRGMRYFDTAPRYGLGLSEIRTGSFLRDQAKKEDYALSSKVGMVPKRTGKVVAETIGFMEALPYEPFFDYSYDGIMTSIEQSYLRLGVESIDILYVHDLGEKTHGEEYPRHFKAFFDGGGYKALEELKKSGEIKAIGLGIMEEEGCFQAMKQARFDCILLAGCYTLLRQTALGLFDLCLQSETSIIAAGVYNSGILVTGLVEGAKYQYKEASEEVKKKVIELQKICAEHGVPLPAVALQFALMHPVVVGEVVGLAHSFQVEKTMEWLEIKVPESLWRDLKTANLLHPEAPIP